MCYLDDWLQRNRFVSYSRIFFVQFADFLASHLRFFSMLLRVFNLWFSEILKLWITQYGCSLHGTRNKRVGVYHDRVGIIFLSGGWGSVWGSSRPETTSFLHNPGVRRSPSYEEIIQSPLEIKHFPNWQTTFHLQSLQNYFARAKIEIWIKGTQLNMTVFLLNQQKFFVQCTLLYTCTLEKSLFPRYIPKKHGHV